MKSRLLAMGAAVVMSAVLAACGGGGGNPPPNPTPAPTATPTPIQTPTATPPGIACVGSAPFAMSSRRAMAAPPHPISAGDSFGYTGTFARTFEQSEPCPQPTATQNATVAVSVTDSATSGPGNAATDQQSVERDAFSTQTTTTTTDLAVRNTASAYQLFQTRSSDPSGNSIATTYANAQQLDMLPESAGQSWGGNSTNNPTAAVTEQLADGTAIARAVSGDGSYVDTETFADGSISKITVNGQADAKSLDGSGTYALPGVTFGYAAPVSGTITLTITSSGSKTRTFPAWFTVPASYISDTFADNGSQSFDASCSVGSGIVAASGGKGNQIVETYTVLDPVLGYQETRLTTSYVVDGFGAACVKIDDTLNAYYDYQNDTTKIDYQSANGQPNSVDHIVEFLGMSSPSSAYPSLRSASVSRTGVSPVSVAQRVAAIEHLRDVERAQRIETLHNAVLKLSGKGAVR